MKKTETNGQLLDETERDRLIAAYTPLVHSIANTLHRRLPANVEKDDLVQNGLVGLVVAVLQFTKLKTAEHFRNYVSQRVRGAILDGLRDEDHGSRQVRREMRHIEQAIQQLSQQLGRSPNESEVAQALAMPLRTYQNILMRAEGYILFSLDDFDDRNPEKNFIEWCTQNNTDPLLALERKDLLCTLLLAASALSTREEEVMSLYYVDELAMSEIGNRLGVSLGRISQIHAQAIAKLRAAVIHDESKPGLLAPRWRTAEAAHP